MPQQSALIHFDDGVEYLAIETHILGEGEEFAWVVPTPSPAEVEPVTTGVFPQLRLQLAPRIVHDPPDLLASAVPILIAFVLLAGRYYFGLLVFILLLVFGAGLLLPALGRASLSPGGPLGVTVHDRKIVGAYDTAVISGTSGTALNDWLEVNGFAVGEGLEPVIDAYVAEGWSFVAARLRREEGSDAKAALTPHPLGLRFATERPVYPLRLTGVGNGELDVELFVFADRGTEAEGFSVARCSRIESPDAARRSRTDSRLSIHHTEIARIVGDATVVTHLTARLSEEQMKRDAAIELVGFARREPTRYSFRGARETAANAAVIVMTIGPIIVLRRPNEALTLAHAGRVGLVIAAGVVVGVSVGAALPTIDIATSTDRRMGYGGPGALHSAVERIIELEDRRGPLSIEQVRTIAADVVAGRYAGELVDRWSPDLRNMFTGRRIIEEDSPGNYTVREYNGEIEIVDHKLDGSESGWRIRTGSSR